MDFLANLGTHIVALVIIGVIAIFFILAAMEIETAYLKYLKNEKVSVMRKLLIGTLIIIALVFYKILLTILR